MRKRRRHYDVEEAYRDRTHTVIAYDARDSIHLLSRALVTDVRLTPGEIYSGLCTATTSMAWRITGQDSRYTDIYRVGAVNADGRSVTLQCTKVHGDGLATWEWR